MQNAEPEIFDDDIIDYRYYIDLLRTVLLRNYKIISLFCLVSVFVSVLYIQSQAPAYVATVTMHIAPGDRVFSFEQWMYSDEDKFQDTQIGILQSKKLLRRVVRETDLHHAQKLTPESFDAGVAIAIKSWFAELALRDNEDIIVPEQDKIESTASELSSLVNIAKPPDREYSNLLNVTVRMAQPDLAATTANKIAEVYIALAFENEIASALKSQQFLTDRLLILKADLRVAEQRLQEYRENENILARSTGRDELDEELRALSNRYFESQENRLRQENLHEQLRNATAANRSWEKLPVISNHPSVNQIQADIFSLNQRKGELSRRYGGRHNKMIALESEIQSAERSLQIQVSDIIAGVRNEYELSVKIEKAAEETLNSVRNRKQQLGRTEYQLNELLQDVESKREVYSIFLERLNQDGAAGPVRNDNLWVADPAITPKSGQRTSLLRTAIIALILSFGIATSIGLFFELTSNTLATGDDVEKKLNMPLLGFLPLIAHEGDEPGLTFSEYINNPESRFSEALRTLRTSISLLTLTSSGVNRFLVTSSQSHEGKTSVALSLAAAFGQTSKVLLIDGDLRKPSLEKILNTTNHKLPGITEVIAATTNLDDAIQHFDTSNIDVLFAGSRTLRPLELLASHQFTRLMEQLSGRYDTIIIDSPPCISVSDAYLLATQVDNIIYVAKSNTAPVPLIRSCLNRFAGLDASLAGVVLNQIDFEAIHNYGRYQDYYYYQGYSEKQEPAAANT